jgi:PAS domain-containing protein
MLGYRSGKLLGMTHRDVTHADDVGSDSEFVAGALAGERESQLRDSERTRRSVIDNTPAVICVTDREHRYMLVNREFEQVYGPPRPKQTDEPERSEELARAQAAETRARAVGPPEAD